MATGQNYPKQLMKSVLLKNEKGPELSPNAKVDDNDNTVVQTKYGETTTRRT